jgi:DNA-binding MarR family transcriptional regulator
MTQELHDYGPLLIASRLRKLSEMLYAGADAIYLELGVDLPSRCFPIMFLLRDHGRLGISEIAISLGQSHPAVSQMSRKLLAHQVVKEWSDPLDERRRLLGLSQRGVQLMKRLVPIWTAITSAAQEIDGSYPILSSLRAIDQALEKTDFATRIRVHMNQS